MGQRRAIRKPRADFQLAAKERQASKLAEIREALAAAGFDTTAKQAAVLGVCRSTAWVVLNRDKKIGPSANIIKRILSALKLPPAARRKVEEYVEERISGLFGHTEGGVPFVSRRVSYPSSRKRRLNRIHVHPAGP
jgi:hypothetical protein